MTDHYEPSELSKDLKALGQTINDLVFMANDYAEKGLPLPHDFFERCCRLSREEVMATSLQYALASALLAEHAIGVIERKREKHTH